ncbi:alpha/beta hydrolase [Gordonia sp. HY002]|uniref:alpha/beta fold hydrolase n=1 Tax=Gordonia zhenghanii TaxID=2911516 RepID=UPI001EF099DB|nr:alpha/beta hydrolase [Gordonia zhenghanii]MCF8572281.1 alpha/beta hydrolase [Gordonia zhenghanii]MCF8607741.1 alpha/beta hydrolase [Gordonia zhenghanii]
MLDITPEPLSIDSGAVRIVGDRWASETATGTPIVLLHGGGQTRHSWDRSAAALAERGREVYTIDLRGHGDSSWAPDGDYGIDAFVGDIHDVVTAIGRAPILVGASLGGITSLCLAGENPDTAAALVMVDVVVHVEPEGIGRIQSFMTDHIDGFATLEDVADAVTEYNPERKRPRNLEGLKKNVRLHDDGRWYWHWDPAFIRSSGNEARRHTDPARLSAAAQNVKVPTLIVRGGKSDVVSEAGVASMLELVPHADVADVSAAGHMVAGDDNQVFASAIDDFLDKHAL